MEVSTVTYVASAAYIAVTGALLGALALFAVPAVMITRRRASYFDDWNDTLQAPWLFWHIGGLLFRAQELFGNYVLPAPQRVCDLAYSHFRSQVVMVVNELGIPDLLADKGPMTAAQLAAATGAHREYLQRVLRAADRIGIVRTVRTELVSGSPAAVKQQAARRRAGEAQAANQRRQQLRPKGKDEGRQLAAPGAEGRFPRGRFDLGDAVVYDLTQLSAVMTERHPNSVKAMVSLFWDHYGPAGSLLEGVKTGRTPYEVYSGGKTHWQHMGDVPELYARFNRAMAQFNSLSPIEAVFMAYPQLARAPRVVDVGGGIGGFVGAALSRHPGLRGSLFDLPNVIKHARASWEGEPEKRALLDRLSFHPGSFFDAGAIPRAEQDGEVFVLREILHDWSDADCLRILREVRAAVGDRSGCRLLLVEACISEQMASSASARINGDIHMLVQYGDAQERTEAQFNALLAASGFQLQRVVPTKGLFFVLEATTA